MNERIIELAEQASHQSPDGYPVTIPFSKVFAEKFAELIVQECAEQSMSIGRYNTPSGITPDLAIAISVGLKKHFGVGELAYVDRRQWKYDPMTGKKLWQGLTADERIDCEKAAKGNYFDLLDEHEAKLKEKNHGSL